MESWGHSLIGFAAVLGIPDWKTVIAFWPQFLAVGLGAYVLGSIPIGLLLARVAGKGDIRRMGSGNIGATNVLRTGSKGLAVATLFFDMAKGAAAVWLARSYAGGLDAAFFAGLAVVVGHIFPVWLGFRGGKGVATTLGVLFAVAWPVGLVAVALWLAAGFAFRISSLAALIATAGAPVAAWVLSGSQAATLAGLLALLVWIRHAGNIVRLLRGQEPTVKLK